MSESRFTRPECVDALRTMYMFLDHELDQEDEHHIQQHLDECIPCLEAFEFEVELKQVISHHCQEEMPATLMETVKARLSLEIRANSHGEGIRDQ